MSRCTGTLCANSQVEVRVRPWCRTIGAAIDENKCQYMWRPQVSFPNARSYEVTHRQGLTLVHIFAQPEPLLSLNQQSNPPNGTKVLTLS